MYSHDVVGGGEISTRGKSYHRDTFYNGTKAPKDCPYSSDCSKCPLPDCQYENWIGKQKRLKKRGGNMDD